MNNKHLDLVVSRCVNSTSNNNHCHSHHAIDDYLTDAVMEQWVVQNQPDFSIYRQDGNTR